MRPAPRGGGWCGVFSGGGPGSPPRCVFPAPAARAVPHWGCAPPRPLRAYGSCARRLRTADYPWGWSAEHLAEVLRGMDQGWASGKWWAAANPSVADDWPYHEWW